MCPLLREDCSFKNLFFFCKGKGVGGEMCLHRDSGEDTTLSDFLGYLFSVCMVGTVTYCIKNPKKSLLAFLKINLSAHIFDFRSWTIGKLK